MAVKGLTTPLSCWVQVGVYLRRFSVTCTLSPTGLIPWFSKTKGNTYATIAASPIPLQGKPTQAQDVALVKSTSLPAVRQSDGRRPRGPIESVTREC